MVLRRRSGGLRKKPARRQFVGKRMRMYRSPRRYNTQVFSETFIPQTSIGVNPATGDISLPGGNSFVPGKFLFQMKEIPQVSQYSNLYQMYKILSITALIIPAFNSMDPNSAQYNVDNSVAAWEVPRIAYSVNDNPNDLLAPTTELDVLKDNGCRITQLTKPFKITFRPKAALDALNPTTNNNIAQLPKFSPWVGFDGEGQDVVHSGVDWVITQGNTASVSQQVIGHV